MARFWAEKSIGQALVIARGVIIGDAVVNGCPQRLLSKQDHPLQTGSLNPKFHPGEDVLADSAGVDQRDDDFY